LKAQGQDDFSSCLVVLLSVGCCTCQAKFHFLSAVCSLPQLYQYELQKGKGSSCGPCSDEIKTG